MVLGNFFFSSSTGEAAYEIEQSLRIAQGSYLYRTNSSGGNAYTWTYSCWVKRGTFTEAIDAILAANQNYGNDWDSDSLQFHTGNYGLSIYNNRSQSTRANGTTNAKYRDPSAWMHIVAVWDNTNSTSTDKFRYYINGERATISWNTTPTGDSSLINTTTTMRIGQNASVNSEKYMAEVHFIDGTAVTDANDFGEYDDNGVWRPIEYTGSYGSNGYYLKFDPSATNGVGHDHSGNGNNWSTQNIVTSGTGTDVMSDTPTTNWCTLNPLTNIFGGVATYAEGNLKATQANGPLSNGTISLEFNAYWEVYVDQTGDTVAGWGIKAADDFTQSGNSISISPRGVYRNASWVSGGTSGGGSAAISNGDTLGFAFTASTKSLAIYVNNTLEDTVTVTDTTRTYLPSAWSGGGVTLIGTWNFGQRDFAYTPPTGFEALNTSNLPAPDVADGSEYFTTLAYSGTSTTDSKVIEDSQGNDWAPDFVWLKKRNSGANHMLYDRVRGASKSLRSNTTGAEVTGATNGDLTAFTSTGFTLNSGNDVNASGNTYVAWNWLAGGSGSSNTSGSITSTVSANPTAGFSIATYTGNATSGATVGHGLGVQPSMIIIKNRDEGSTNWIVGHTAITLGSGRLILDTDASNDSSNAAVYWNSTAASSTVVTLGNSSSVNRNGDSHVMYCFAEVEGYSKFGSYTGNGNADGPFVYCGFRPAWIMTKNWESTGSWLIRDTARETYNPTYAMIPADNNNSEATSTGYYEIDILSNGFKVRVNNTSVNRSNSGFVFAAFAENPFGGSGVSPATAR